MKFFILILMLIPELSQAKGDEWVDHGPPQAKDMYNQTPEEQQALLDYLKQKSTHPVNKHRNEGKNQ